MAIPLVAGAEVLGALMIYAREPEAFDGEELRLLEQLADDLAFGIAAQRAKVEREQAIAALRCPRPSSAPASSRPRWAWRAQALTGRCWR